MMQHHFVITRFNLRKGFTVFRDVGKTPPTDLILDSTYLTQRFEIFETYTLPSLKRQTCQNFRWIVLFHAQTPEPFKEKIRALKTQYDFTDLYFTDDEKFSFADFVTATDNTSEWFITSRIDNDDMFAENYIEMVQEYARRNLRRCIVSFPDGQKLDLRTGKVHAHYRRDNHFLSSIFQRGEWMPQRNHTEIFESGEEVIVLPSNQPMWTEILHETNVINDADTFLRRVYSSIIRWISSRG